MKYIPNKGRLVLFERRRIHLIIVVLILSVILIYIAWQFPKSNIIRQVDHVLIASNDAEELFLLLTETFQLPTAWPMSNYGRFTSGGVAVGNVNLEVIKMPVFSDLGERSRLIGFAFEPEPLYRSRLVLDARKIAHGPVMPFAYGKSDGSATNLWTTMSLPDLMNESIVVFLCEYAHDVEAKRQQSQDQLKIRNGGPLTIELVKEIVVGTTDEQESKKHWQRLLDPLLQTSPGYWQLEKGPALRVISSDKEGIQEIVISVKSLEQARQFLSEMGLIGIDMQDAIIVGNSYFTGLSIRLVEKD